MTSACAHSVTSALTWVFCRQPAAGKVGPSIFIRSNPSHCPSLPYPWCTMPRGWPFSLQQRTQRLTRTTVQAAAPLAPSTTRGRGRGRGRGSRRPATLPSLPALVSDSPAEADVEPRLDLDYLQSFIRSEIQRALTSVVSQESSSHPPTVNDSATMSSRAPSATPALVQSAPSTSNPG